MCERACVCEESQDGQRWVVVVVVMVLQCMKISMEKLGRVIEEEDSKMDRLAEVREGRRRRRWWDCWWWAERNWLVAGESSAASVSAKTCGSSGT